MSRTVVAVLAFAAGIGAGLVICKLYVRSRVQSAADDVLSKIPYVGDSLKPFVHDVIVPAVA